jgi:transcriptional regulator with XRE-family HTH domain
LLDPERVKRLRVERAWSQEQLAEISGLSLRTIQRIEKRGKASMESKKALASVFEVGFAALEPPPDVVRRQQIDVASLRFVLAGGLIGLVFGLAGGGLGLAHVLSGSVAWGVAAGLVGIVGLVGGVVFGVKAHRAMHSAPDGDRSNKAGDE